VCNFFARINQFTTYKNTVNFFIILFAILVLVPISVFAQSDTIDVIEVEQSQYVINRGENVVIKIFGEIDIEYRSESLKIIHTSPDGIPTTHSIKTTDKGYYEIYFQHYWESPRGTYLISTVRDSIEIGTTSYDLVQDPSYQSTEEIMEEYNSDDTKEPNITESWENNNIISSKIPNWVKDIFGWYYLDKISEDEVISAIEYLVTKNIIKLD
jgi:hypothetical protein